MRSGSHLTIEQKAKDSASLMGHIVSDETRTKLSNATKGRVYPPMADTTRQALLKANTGRQKTVDELAKLSVAHRGIKFSLEHCASLSANHREQHGELNPSWKGGITPEQAMIRTGDDYAVWRTSVFNRDAFACQKCGQVGGRLRAHHMDCFSDFPEKRMDVNNGIALCASCHTKLHREYGTKHNRKWQTDEFLGELP